MTSVTITRGLSEETLLELSQANGEPEWLKEQRLAAWKLYQEMPEPPPPQRNIRRFKHLEPTALTLESKGQTSELNELTSVWGTLSGSSIVDQGQQTKLELDNELKAKGVILTSLADAIQNHAELVQPHLAKIVEPHTSKLAALNTAFWQDGLFLYIPANQEIKEPFYLLKALSEVEQAGFSRTLVVVEKFSQVACIYDSFSANGDGAAYVSEVIEIHVADGANVHAIQRQQLGSHVQNHSLVRAHVQRDATFNNLVLSLGAHLHFSNVQVILPQPGASAYLMGLNLGTDNQHFRQTTLQKHIAPHTNSDLLYHSVLRDKSYSFFNGFIEVDKTGQQTVSNQLNKNLILGDKARADSIPNLEIIADDVQSGHGAAVGQLDEEQLFYLMSRGFDRDKAEEMVISGFMEAVIYKLPEGLQERVTSALGLTSEGMD